MAENEFGLKELYNVVLKATYPIEIGNKEIEEGEVIAYFDSIQISNFQEIKSYVTAHGGFDDRAYVWWETTKEVNFIMERGIFSKVQFSLLSNSNLVHMNENEPILIQTREETESNEQGRFKIKHSTVEKVFAYDKETGEKLECTWVDFTHRQVSKPYTNLVVDYSYEYDNGGSLVNIGQRLIKGYLRLEGRTKIKDDVTGQTHTGIIIIPKLKLMSDLSMRLGENATPMVGQIRAKLFPDGERTDSRVIEMYFLNDDIDSDM